MAHGHCLCGEIRFVCDDSRIFGADICHCESCRRATAAPLVAGFAVPDTAWRWLGDTPRRFASSPGVTRWFCPTCGTQMAYQTRDLPGETQFYTATLEDPDAVPPQTRCFADEAPDWTGGMLDLPRRNP